MEKNTQEKESFIVVHYDEFGRDYDEEYSSLEDAIKGLIKYTTCYEIENGGSFRNNMSEPTLCHPDGSGRYWCLDKNDWI